MYKEKTRNLLINECRPRIICLDRETKLFILTIIFDTKEKHRRLNPSEIARSPNSSNNVLIVDFLK